MDAPNRALVTEDAAELLRTLQQRHGTLMFHQSGGCCDGSSPMCYPDGDFIVGDRDVLLAVLDVAGALTGVSATAASIGGPFFSLALQEEQPQRARSTLAPFFLVGSLLSLTGLVVGGQLPRDAWTAGLGWLPFMAVGALLAQPLRHRIDQARFKRVVFALATTSALGVIARVALT